MEHPFTDQEMLYLFECALQGLSNPANRYIAADNLDIDEEILKKLEIKLWKFMNPEEE